MTLVDWYTGQASNFDFFAPHSTIESILIATEEHNCELFEGEAGKWQEMMGKLSAKTSVVLYL